MDMSAITTAITNVTGVMTTVLGVVANNALLMLLLAVPAVGAGAMVFRKIAKSTHV